MAPNGLELSPYDTSISGELIAMEGASRAAGALRAPKCGVLRHPQVQGASRPPGRTRLTLPHSTAPSMDIRVAIFADGLPRTWDVGFSELLGGV